MKKKFLALSLVIGVLASSLISCGGDTASNGGNDNVIKIGAIGPLSGKASTYGQSVKNGAELYIEEVNKAGGINGKEIKFIFEDDQADQNAAMNAFNKLVDSDKVSAIIGAVTSGPTLAIAPKSTTAKIPLITPTGTEPNITKNGGEYMFRGCYIDSYQGEILSSYASNDLKAKKAAVLYNVGSDYSKGIADTFKAEFEKAGGQVTQFLTYGNDDKDFNAQLTKIKTDNPEILILPDYYNVVALIAKQARDMGITAKFLGGDGWESEELYKLGGDSVNGAVYVNHYFKGDEDPVVKSFVDSYRTKYNAEPDAFAALAYDTTKILVEAIKTANSTEGEVIKNALKDMKLKGVTGEIYFDNDRSAIKGATIVEVDGAKTKLVTKVAAK
ncbi:MAG: ABC transporter substrate-binding protein [Sarcina sp.]